MKVLIADDEMLARKELTYMIKDNPLVDSIEEADSAEETAQKVADEKDIDMVFMDIQLGDGNGISLGKQINTQGYRPRVVFATAYDQYALDAFDANAVDYVLKPFEQSRIDAAIKRVAESLGKEDSHPSKENDNAQRNNPRLSVTNDDQTEVINKADIVFASVDNGSLIIQTKQKRFLVKQTMNHLLKVLNPNQFLRVHRSFVVNLNEVRGAEPSFNHTYQLTMSDHSKIPVGRSYISDMKSALGM